MQHTQNNLILQEALIDELIRKARTNKKPRFTFSKPLELEQELRRKRMALMGSSLPLTTVIFKEENGRNRLDNAAVIELSDYLAARTVAFWDKPYHDGMRFCRQFFELCIVAVGDPSVGDECFDNLILLSHTLVRSKEIFMDVMSHLLDRKIQYHDLLRSVTYDFSADYYNAAFESSVQSAIAVFLGVLSDPLEEEEGE